MHSKHHVDSINLLEIDNNTFNASLWTTTNATIRTVPGVGVQETELGSGVGTNGFLIVSEASGDFSATSPLFPVTGTAGYQASAVVTVGSTMAGETVKLRWDYFSVTAATGGSAVSAIGETATTGAWVSSTQAHEVSATLSPDATAASYESLAVYNSNYPFGFQSGVPVNGANRFWVPSGANYARVVLTFETASAAGVGLLVSDVFAVKITGVLDNVTLNSTYGLLPDYLKSEDKKPDVVGLFGHLLVMKKLLASSFAQGVIVGEEMRTWSYTRATDSDTGTEKLSELTDPQTMKRSYLDWIAQLVGVKLINPFTGLNMWLALPGWNEDTDSTNWQSIDLLDGESVEDSVTWIAARSSTYENVQSYRDQIQYAFNGLNAGKPSAMLGYLGTIMDTDTPETYFMRIKAGDRESPFLVKYVYDPEIDPDVGGTRVQTEMEPTLGMGLTGTQSSKPRDAAVFAFEAKDVLEANVPGAGAVANDDTVFKFGDSACSAVPDVTGSGRHVSLVTAGTAIDPKDSRYGIIAGSRYSAGFSFYPSGVTGSKAYLQSAAVSTGLTGTDCDYLFHISDINHGNSSDLILFQQGTPSNANYRACTIDASSGILKYLTGVSGSVSSDVYSSSTHPVEYDFTISGDRWVRFAVGASTTKFYVAPSLIEVCHPTSHLITSASQSSPNVFSTSFTAQWFQVNHGENGLVGYRAIVNDGLLDSQYAGFLLSTCIDLNMKSSSTTTPVLYDGVDTFTQSSTLNTDVAYTIQYEASPLPVSNWIGLPHTGTDYLYLGNQSSSGDSIVVSGMDNDTYNWTVYYTDGSTATGTGTGVTTITWSAGTYGGKQITQIVAVGTKTYTFLPSIALTHTTTTSTGTDATGGTWTINRAWETADAYEHSAIVDRNLFQANREGGRMAPNLAVGRDTAMSISFSYRRWKLDGGADYVFKHPNLKLRFDGDNVIGTVTEQYDFSSAAGETTDVTWDDSSRIGQWNHVGLVRDVAGQKVILYANGVKIQELADDTLDSLASRLGIPDADVIFHTDDEPGWQFNHFAVFKEALSSADMERVRVTLPT
ncbi:MAG: hypothetical protein CL489_11035 [Acidobacteria bacterium]|nr:hypothetical protein [Acidobacteriota bacterium]